MLATNFEYSSKDEQSQRAKNFHLMLTMVFFYCVKLPEKCLVDPISIAYYSFKIILSTKIGPPCKLLIIIVFQALCPQIEWGHLQLYRKPFLRGKLMTSWDKPHLAQSHNFFFLDVSGLNMPFKKLESSYSLLLTLFSSKSWLMEIDNHRET